MNCFEELRGGCGGTRLAECLLYALYVSNWMQPSLVTPNRKAPSLVIVNQIPEVPLHEDITELELSGHFRN